MRNVVASVFGASGLVCVVVGAALVSAAAGWVVGGLAALWVAERLS